MESLKINASILGLTVQESKDFICYFTRNYGLRYRTTYVVFGKKEIINFLLNYFLSVQIYCVEKLVYSAFT